MKTDLRYLSLTQLDPHPQNPRIVLREDVIEGIRASLNGSMAEEHALLVRPLDGRYQIIAGHQRHEAARRAGLEKVPCWVRDMTDEEAYMALVLDNRQGELTPLEIGIHAFRMGKGNKWKGPKGKEYADLLGRKPNFVSRAKQAAEVFLVVKESDPVKFQCWNLTDDYMSLYYLSDLPKSLWPGAVEALGDLTVAEVEERVRLVNDFLSQHGIPDYWQDYLPPLDCGLAVFEGAHPDKLRRLLGLAKKVAADATLDNDLVAEWREWLTVNKGGDSWDIAACQRKRIELEERQREREEVAALPPLASVVLADPPWQYNVLESDNRRIENHYPTATVAEIIAHADQLSLAPDCVLFLWATAPLLREALEVMEGWGFEYKTHAVWDKERPGLGYWFRVQHELLLIGTRGKVSPPPPALRCPSVFRERRDEEHSRKPESVYRAIESMFPLAVKLEMYCRGVGRPGWLVFGLEAESAKRKVPPCPDQ
jgi:ParB/RepB/Spo0J family partition protein